MDEYSKSAKRGLCKVECWTATARDFAGFRFLSFADAALVRRCSTLIVAARRASPIRPFASVGLTKSETVLSPQLDPTNQTGTMRPLPIRVFADAASARRCGTLFAVLQSVSPERPLRATSRSGHSSFLRDFGKGLLSRLKRSREISSKYNHVIRNWLCENGATEPRRATAQ